MYVVFVLCYVVVVRGINPRCGIGWIAEMRIGFIEGFWCLEV